MDIDKNYFKNKNFLKSQIETMSISPILDDHVKSYVISLLNALLEEIIDNEALLNEKEDLLDEIDEFEITVSKLNLTLLSMKSKEC